MRRRLGYELFPYDLEIERTLWRGRRGRVIIENQLKGGMDGLDKNMGKANGQGKNKSQALNTPKVNPHPQEANQQHLALRDNEVPPIIQLVIRAPPIQVN